MITRANCRSQGKASLARPIGTNETIVPARKQAELSVTQKLFIAGCEGQVLEIDILAEGLERLGVEATLLGGSNDTLHREEVLQAIHS